MGIWERAEVRKCHLDWSGRTFKLSCRVKSEGIIFYVEYAIYFPVLLWLVLCELLYWKDILYQQCLIMCRFFNQHLGFIWIRPHIILVQKSLGGDPKGNGLWNWFGWRKLLYIFCLKKLILAQNQCHVFTWLSSAV